MLTKLKRDLSNRPTIADVQVIRSVPSIVDEEEEEEDNTWQPSNGLKATLKTLRVFENFEDMSKKEIKDSYINFDNWLKSEIYRIVSIEKGKEDDSIWGDLE